jgi:hypothetical protein
MEKLAAVFLTAIALAGCVFDPSGIAAGDGWFVDSACDNCKSDFIADGATIDVGKKDSVKPKPDAKIDSKKSDAIKSDSPKPDILKPDSQKPDALKPDSKPSCAGVNCNYGSCDPKTGKCVCNTGFDGTYCNQCAYAYGPAPPACNALSSSVSVKILGSSPYPKGSTQTVEVTFTNATTYKFWIECVLGPPCPLGQIYIPPSGPKAITLTGNLPSATTNVPKVFTVKWILGTSGPADRRFQAEATGPKDKATDNKSIAIQQ